jgi:hypothetical protein
MSKRNTPLPRRNDVADRIIDDLRQSGYYNEEHSCIKLKPPVSNPTKNRVIHDSCFLANCRYVFPDDMYRQIVDYIAWKLCNPIFSADLSKALGMSYNELVQVPLFVSMGFSYSRSRKASDFSNQTAMIAYLNKFYCPYTNFMTLVHIVNLPEKFGHIIPLYGEGSEGISNISVIDVTRRFYSTLRDDITAYLHIAGGEHNQEHTVFFVLLVPVSRCEDTPIEIFQETVRRSETDPGVSGTGEAGVEATVEAGVESGELAKAFAERPEEYDADAIRAYWIKWGEDQAEAKLSHEASVPVPPPPPPFTKCQSDPGPSKRHKMGGGAPLKNKSKRKKKPRRSRKYKTLKSKKTKKKRLPKRRTTRRT